MDHILLCDLTHTGQGIALEAFPYGIGCIATYLEKHFPTPISAHILKFPENVSKAFHRYQPGIVGFSNYAWNSHLSISMAKAIKEQYSETIVIFGGPNFPTDKNSQEYFLFNNSFIDFYIEGEGEQAFLDLLKLLYKYEFNLAKVKSVGSPGMKAIHEGIFISFPPMTYFKNLDEIPSPYLSGKMDKFFRTNLKPLIQTTRGCPFSCTYCVEGYSNYNTVARHHDKTVILKEIEYIAKRAKRNRQLNIADSNFGMYIEDIDVATALGDAMAKWNFPLYVHVATGKNRKDRVLEVAKLLKGRLRLSGSVQTLDQDVLQNINRKNISTDELLGLAAEARKVDANSYSEIIIGLPGDSKGSFFKSIQGVLEAGFNYIVAYTLMNLKGSRLYEHKLEGKFGLESKFRVLPKCFGKYSFRETTFISCEIEEVLVSSSTLPFEDYLECRKFTLTLALFYNDRLFEEITGILKFLGISIYKWLFVIHKKSTNFPSILSKIYEDFIRDTEEELWNSEGKLLEFSLQPENMLKLIDGDLGFNVMYFYRAKSLTTAMQELNDIAFDSASTLIETESSSIALQCEQFISQLKYFSLLRKRDLFNFSDLNTEADFSFDFKMMLDNNSWDIPPSNEKMRTCSYRFFHSRSQVDGALEQMEIFGKDDIAITKILSRIPIHSLYRNVEEL